MRGSENTGVSLISSHTTWNAGLHEDAFNVAKLVRMMKPAHPT